MQKGSKMRTNGLILGTLITIASACSPTVGHVKPKTLDMAINEEGRICAGKIRQCREDHFKKTPNASQTESIPECNEVRDKCLQAAEEKLNIN